MTELSFYWIGKLIGKGNFGWVNMVMHKLAMKLLAMKTINKKLITTGSIFDKIENEIRLLKSINHEHIIKIYDTFET